MNVNVLSRRPALTRDEAYEIRMWVRRNCDQGDLFDFARLPDGDQTEFARLARLVATDTGGVDWGKIGRRDRARFEELLAAGAGHARSFFADRRRDAETRRKFDALKARTVARPRLRRRQAVDFAATMAENIRSGHFYVSHAAILVALVGALQSGRPLGPHQRVFRNGDGAELEISPVWGLFDGRANGDGAFTGWEEQLDWLARQRWLTVEKRRGAWRIGLGARTLRALGDAS